MNEDLKEKIIAVSEGNPGALSVLMQLAQIGFDEAINYLSEYGPKGPGLWMLYKDCCYQDLQMLAGKLLDRIEKEQPEVYEKIMQSVALAVQAHSEAASV